MFHRVIPRFPVTLLNPLFADGILYLLLNLLSLGFNSLDTILKTQLLLSSPVVVVKVSVHLGELRTLIDEVAAEQEPVHGAHGEGVAHEGSGVNAKSTGHLSGDPIDIRDERWSLEQRGSQWRLTGQGSFVCPRRQQQECRNLTQVPRNLSR